MPELELEPESHRYTLDGVQIPGCTAVLAAMGCTPGFNFLTPGELEYYRSRGTAVHSCVEMSVKGHLDHRSKGYRDVRGYMIGWERAQNDLGITVLKLNGEPFVEIPLCHPTYRYGVKPDVVAYVEAFKDSGPIEVKATSAHAPATGIQLGSQLIAIRHVLPDIGKLRVGLRLIPKEPYYDMKIYDERSDEATWISLLNSYNWLVRHKLLRTNGGR
jgi:hypothetical protein